MEKQLQMIKYGGFSYQDVDTMPLYEFNSYYELLSEMMKESSGLEELEKDI